MWSERLTWSVSLGESYTDRRQTKCDQKGSHGPEATKLRRDFFFYLNLTFPQEIYIGIRGLRSKLSPSTFYGPGPDLSVFFTDRQTDDKHNIIRKAHLVCPLRWKLYKQANWRQTKSYQKGSLGPGAIKLKRDLFWSKSHFSTRNI